MLMVDFPVLNRPLISRPTAAAASGLSARDLAESLTMSGTEVEDTQDLGDDAVLTLEVTSNRPDLLGVIGIARENNTDDLLKAGADIVVSDLADLEGLDMEKFSLKQPSYLFDFWDKAPDKISTEKGELKAPSDKVFFNSPGEPVGNWLNLDNSES